MNKLMIVSFVIFVATSAENNNLQLTKAVPVSRQIAHDGYNTQTEVVYPQPAPYQTPYPPLNEGLYPPSKEEVNSDAQSHKNEQVLDNPSYDPNLYQTFVPQDSVQQYVNSYVPYTPNGQAVGVHPYAYGGPGGFAIQSGYEGYLVPAIPPPPPPPAYGGTGVMDVFRNALPYPRTILSMLMRSGTYLLNSIGVVLFGGAVTTAICSFTPLCTITFAALPFLGLREGLTSKTIKEQLANEITSDRVRRAAEFVRTALDKYNQIQGDTSKEVKKDVSSDESVKKVTEKN